MYDMISERIYIEYPEICICCTSRIIRNNIICDLCFGYLNKTQCDRILELRRELMNEKLISKL